MDNNSGPRNEFEGRQGLSGRNITPIARMKFEHRIGNVQKDHAAKNTLYQFPLTLASAMTIHKCQGFTIKPPETLCTDLKSSWLGGMSYVVCGRIKRLDQLYLSSFKKENIRVDTKALEENYRLSALAKKRVTGNLFRNNWCRKDPKVVKVASLNIQSLGGEDGHIADIRADHTLREADILCLSETWLKRGTSVGPKIEGYLSYAASNGQGAGVAIYMKEGLNAQFIEIRPYIRDDCQLLRLELKDMVIIAAYRSPSLSSKQNIEQFSKVITDGIDGSKITVVCGDMNVHFHPHNPCDNALTSSLYKKGFVQLVREATHIQGHILDHIYVRACKNIAIRRPLHQLHYPYYSDHEAVLLMLKQE